MLPIPSQNAVFAFVGASLMLVVAMIAGSTLGTVLACCGFIGLSFVLMLTMPLGARLREERLEFAWWQSHAEGGGAEGSTAGTPFELKGYIRNRSDRPLRFIEVLPIVPAGVRLLSGENRELVLPPRTRTEFSFTLSAAAAGRYVLQGLAVSVPGPLALFRAPLYFPSPLAVKVLPRSVLRHASLDLVAGGQQVERAGLSPLRRRGGGTELHEIREHRPGDPFKSIAWKISARTGRLMVREVETEVQETIYLVLDVSGSMRGGRPGERKLDHAIELCAMIARSALDRGDRVGLVAVDGRVVTHAPPAEGHGHMLRLYEALLYVTEIVDADLTELDDETVAQLVGRYLRHQEGRPIEPGPAGLENLVMHAQRALAAEHEHDEVTASSPAYATLRRFCRLRGIPLPYRPDTRAFGKGAGLSNALREAGGHTRMPRTLVCISDFDGVYQIEPLLKTLALLRAHHHSVTFLYPDAESFGKASGGSSKLARDLRYVYGMQERRRLSDVRARLAPYGARVLPFAALDDRGQSAQRAQSLSRVA